MAEDPHDLARFVDAQAADYDQALAEIRAGRKRSHYPTRDESARTKPDRPGGADAVTEHCAGNRAQGEADDDNRRQRPCLREA